MTRFVWLAVLLWLLPTAALAQTSPDGTTLPPASSLTADGGTWTLGTALNSGNQYPILFNGAPASTGSAIELEVANGGQVYAYSTYPGYVGWFVWNGTAWAPSSNPNTTTTGSSAGGGTTTPTTGPLVLAGSTSLSAPLAPWYQINSAQSAIVVLPACSAISGNIYFETIGTGQATLQLSSGSWMDQPPNAQSVPLSVWGSNATAYVSSDGTNCHISFGGAPP